MSTEREGRSRIARVPHLPGVRGSPCPLLSSLDGGRRGLAAIDFRSRLVDPGTVSTELQPREVLGSWKADVAYFNDAEWAGWRPLLTRVNMRIANAIDGQLGTE
jgi:hypothetical protein